MFQNSRERRYSCRQQPFWETPVQVGEGATAGNAICIVYMGGPGATGSTQEAVEANARLIAAAPDLLEALEAHQGVSQLLAELEFCLDEERGEIERQLRDIEEQARAAITRATGDRPEKGEQQ
ncbi:hypothetical protein [Brevundimonas sp.]|uniref:hypothetical protein n=1 Tax=Brevundimonas sp. TaxID=1871086 RepID=UPI0028A21E29|nr:hypothetical protein [Brevundimonas sp.]